MVTCQSANQLKTPAKVSWAFKMVSQFGSLGYTIMGQTADLTVVRIVKLNWFKILGELLPSGPKSSFQMRARFVFHLETKVLESGGRVEKLIAQVAWSPVLSFHSLWWFGVQCHLLVLVHFVFWKLHPFNKKFWSTSCFLLLTSFLKMLISFSSRIWCVFFNVAKIITIKITKDLNYFSLCAFNLFNTRVSQFELNYWNKWTFPRLFNL